MQADETGHVASPTLLGAAVAGTAFAIDQAAKIAAPHLHFGFVAPARNPDYAFGSVGGSAPVLILGSVLVLVVFLAIIGRLAGRVGISPALPALIAGGMLGNTFDRICYGAVRDFLVVAGGIINVADLAIFVGLITLVAALVVRVPPQLATARASRGSR